MSIKIYDGLICHDSDPLSASMKIRALLEPEFFQRFAAAVSTVTDAYEADPDRLLNDLLGEQFSGEAWNGAAWSEPCRHRVYIPKFVHEAVSQLYRSAQWTFSDLDFGYEVLFLPNGSGGNPLLMLCGEQRDHYRELLLEGELVEPYGYWNNGDPDEGVSKKGWKLRRQAWSWTFDRAPREVGLLLPFPGATASELSLRRGY